MSKLLGRIQALIPHFVSQRELDEQYLNKACDIYDVERRQFELEHRTGQSHWYPPATSLTSQ